MARHNIDMATPYADFETEVVSAQSEIVVERREYIGTIRIDPHGPGNAIGEAFRMAGEYIAKDDTDVPVIVEFVAFGRKYRATQNEE